MSSRYLWKDKQRTNFVARDQTSCRQCELRSKGLKSKLGGQKVLIETEFLTCNGFWCWCHHVADLFSVGLHPILAETFPVVGRSGRIRDEQHRKRPDSGHGSRGKGSGRLVTFLFGFNFSSLKVFLLHLFIRI